MPCVPEFTTSTQPVLSPLGQSEPLAQAASSARPVLSISTSFTWLVLTKTVNMGGGGFGKFALKTNKSRSPKSDQTPRSW